MEQTAVDKNIQAFMLRMKESFSIERMRDVDPEKLVAFNMEVYQDEFNAARFANREEIKKTWDWKYYKNPASKDTDSFGWLAGYDEDLIGQFHFIPADVKIGDRLYRAAWGSDLAVLKPYRNMGLSAILIQHARNEVAKDFGLFLLGGMNDNSRAVFEKSGFVDLGKIPRFIKVPGWFKTKRDKSVNVAAVDSFNDEFESFWNSVSPYYECIVKRNTAFLKWRYKDQPSSPYTVLKATRDGKIKGFAAVREGHRKCGILKGRKIGVISDILIHPGDPEAAHSLLMAITDFFREKKVLFIKCEILNIHVEKALKKAGFAKIKPQYSFMLNAHKNKMSESDTKLASVRKNWFVSWGDSDLDYD